MKKHLHEIHYTTESLVERLRQVPPQNQSRNTRPNGTFCTVDWDTALGYVERGYEKVAGQIAAFGDRISVEVANQRPGWDQLSYGEDGDWVDVDKYLEKAYDQVFVSIVEGQEKPIRSLNVIINVSANGMVTAQALETRGAAVAFLCDYFRRIGINIDLWVCDFSRNCPGGIHGDSVDITALYKIDTNEGFSLNQLAAYSALPDFLRRMSFAISELLTDQRSCGGYGGAGEIIQDGKPIPGLPKPVIAALGGHEAIAQALYFGVPDNAWEDMDYTVEQIVGIMDKFNAKWGGK